MLSCRWAPNREELAIQLLELFANIDVNSDRVLEWQEFLNYIVESGFSAPIETQQLDHSAAKSPTTEIEDGITAASYFSAHFAYRPLQSGEEDPYEAGSDDDGEAAATMGGLKSMFEKFTHAESVTDPVTNEVFILAFQAGSMLVHTFRWGLELQLPVLLPWKRFRHESSFQSHKVASATVVPFGNSLRLFTISTIGEDGAVYLNIFDFETTSLLQRSEISIGLAQLVYLPAEQAVLAVGMQTTSVLKFGIHECLSSSRPQKSLEPLHRHSQGESRWLAWTPVTSHLSGSLIVGCEDGTILAWDARFGRAVPGMSVLGHEYGVKCLALNSTGHVLVSTGCGHPNNPSGQSQRVFSLLIWDVQEWVAELRKGGAFKRAQHREEASAAAEKNRLERAREILRRRAEVELQLKAGVQKNRTLMDSARHLARRLKKKDSAYGSFAGSGAETSAGNDAESESELDSSTSDPGATLGDSAFGSEVDESLDSDPGSHNEKDGDGQTDGDTDVEGRHKRKRRKYRSSSIVHATMHVLSEELGLSPDAGKEDDMGYTPLKNLQIRPKELVGHNAPVSSLALQEEVGTTPHIISLDEIGELRVWHLYNGRCLQVLTVGNSVPIGLYSAAASEAAAAAEFAAAAAVAAATATGRILPTRALTNGGGNSKGESGKNGGGGLDGAEQYEVRRRAEKVRGEKTSSTFSLYGVSSVLCYIAVSTLQLNEQVTAKLSNANSFAQGLSVFSSNTSFSAPQQQQQQQAWPSNVPSSSFSPGFNALKGGPAADSGIVCLVLQEAQKARILVSSLAELGQISGLQPGADLLGPSLPTLSATASLISPKASSSLTNSASGHGGGSGGTHPEDAFSPPPRIRSFLGPPDFAAAGTAAATLAAATGIVSSPVASASGSGANRALLHASSSGSSGGGEAESPYFALQLLPVPPPPPPSVTSLGVAVPLTPLHPSDLSHVALSSASEYWKQNLTVIQHSTARHLRRTNASMSNSTDARYNGPVENSLPQPHLKALLESGLVSGPSARRQRILSEEGGGKRPASMLPLLSSQRILQKSMKSCADTILKGLNVTACGILQRVASTLAALCDAAHYVLLRWESYQDTFGTNLYDQCEAHMILFALAAFPIAGRVTGVDTTSKRVGAEASGDLLDRLVLDSIPVKVILTSLLELCRNDREISFMELATSIESWRSQTDAASTNPALAASRLQAMAKPVTTPSTRPRNSALRDTAPASGIVVSVKGPFGPRMSADTRIFYHNRVFAVALPQRVGGPDKRNMLLLGGHNISVPYALVRRGDLLSRHRMRLFNWTQNIPDREPLIRAIFCSPQLHFLTVTASAILVWDALTGRPIRIIDKHQCGGAEITSASLDQRQRKLVVGNAAGNQWVINLVSGVIMKQLDPRFLRPRNQPALTNAPPTSGRFVGGGGLADDNDSNSPETSGAMRFETPIKYLLYSPRQEVISVGGDGSVWICEEESFFGWVKGESVSTLKRAFGPPLEVWRKTRHQKSLSQSNVKTLRTTVSNAQLLENGPANAASNYNSMFASYSSLHSVGDFQTNYGLFSATAASLPRIGSGSLGSLTPADWPSGNIQGSFDADVLRSPGYPLASHNSKAINSDRFNMSQLNLQPENVQPHTTPGKERYPSVYSLPDADNKGNPIKGKNAKGGNKGRDAEENKESKDKKGAKDPNGECDSIPTVEQAPTIRVTAVAFSIRLNLVAMSVRLIKGTKEPTRNTTKEIGRTMSSSNFAAKHTSHEGMQDPASAPVQMEMSSLDENRVIIDDNSYAILLFSYEKATLLGACARSPYDPINMQQILQQLGSTAIANNWTTFNGPNDGASLGVNTPSPYPNPLSPKFATDAPGGSTGTAIGASGVQPTPRGKGMSLMNLRASMRHIQTPNPSQPQLPMSPSQLSDDSFSQNFGASGGKGTISFSSPTARSLLSVASRNSHNDSRHSIASQDAGTPVVDTEASIDLGVYNNSPFNLAQGTLQSDLSELSHLLLPSCTSLSFLDPLPALLSLHDDGGVRIWSVPPARPACCLRMIFFIPDNPCTNLFMPTVFNAHSDDEMEGSPEESSAGTTNGSNSSSNSGAAGGGGGIAMTPHRKKPADSGNSSLSPPAGSPSTATPAATSPTHRRNSLIGGINLSDAPRLIQRRFAVSLAAKPSVLVPPMALGTLFPHGHAAFMPGENATPYAPAPTYAVFAADHKDLKETDPGTAAGSAASKTPSLAHSQGPSRAGSADYARSSASSGGGSHVSGTGHRSRRSSDGAASIGVAPDWDPEVVNNYPAHESGVTLWLGDVDGEIHRFFISSTALAAAGLQTCAPQSTATGPYPDAHLEDTPASPDIVALCLYWSHMEAREWLQRQSKLASALKALPDDPALEIDTRMLYKTYRIPTGTLDRACHPLTLQFYRDSGRNPYFPAVGEALPPTSFLFLEDIQRLNAIQSRADALGMTGVQQTPGLSYQDFRTKYRPQAFKGVELAGIGGAVWEGSWRAHATGDVTSLQVVADSGLFLVLSAGQDGLARVWDMEGRLWGTLDPLPQFTASKAAWENQDFLSEMLQRQLEMQKAKAMEAVARLEAKRKMHIGLSKQEADAVLQDWEDEQSKPPPEAAKPPPEVYAVPKSYGPGYGSRVSYDKQSLAHVSTERVYDGRLIYIPTGAILLGPRKLPKKKRTWYHLSLEDSSEKMKTPRLSPVPPLLTKSPALGGNPMKNFSLSPDEIDAEESASALFIDPTITIGDDQNVDDFTGIDLASPTSPTSPTFPKPLSPSAASSRPQNTNISSSTNASTAWGTSAKSPPATANRTTRHGAEAVLGGKAAFAPHMLRQRPPPRQILTEALLRVLPPQWTEESLSVWEEFDLQLTPPILYPVNVIVLYALPSSEFLYRNPNFHPQPMGMGRNSFTPHYRAQSFDRSPVAAPPSPALGSPLLSPQNLGSRAQRRRQSNVFSPMAPQNQAKIAVRTTLQHVIPPLPGDWNERGTYTGCKVALFAKIDSQIGRKVGLYFSSLAPAPRHCVWHVSWDLQLRREKQVEAAKVALALVTLVKLRDMTGWGRKSTIMAAATRRLCVSILEATGIFARFEKLRAAKAEKLGLPPDAEVPGMTGMPYVPEPPGGAVMNIFAKDSAADENDAEGGDNKGTAKRIGFTEAKEDETPLVLRGKYLAKEAFQAVNAVVESGIVSSTSVVVTAARKVVTDVTARLEKEEKEMFGDPNATPQGKHPSGRNKSYGRKDKRVDATSLMSPSDAPSPTHSDSNSRRPSVNYDNFPDFGFADKQAPSKAAGQGFNAGKPGGPTSPVGNISGAFPISPKQFASQSSKQSTAQGAHAQASQASQQQYVPQHFVPQTFSIHPIPGVGSSSSRGALGTNGYPDDGKAGGGDDKHYTSPQVQAALKRTHQRQKRQQSEREAVLEEEMRRRAALEARGRATDAGFEAADSDKKDTKGEGKADHGKSEGKDSHGSLWGNHPFAKDLETDAAAATLHLLHEEEKLDAEAEACLLHRRPNLAQTKLPGADAAKTGRLLHLRKKYVKPASTAKTPGARGHGQNGATPASVVNMQFTKPDGSVSASPEIEADPLLSLLHHRTVEKMSRK